MEKFRTIISAVVVAAVLAVFSAVYQAQWLFALIAAGAGTFAVCVLRGIAKSMYQPEESGDSEDERAWWQKALVVLKDNRSVAYMILMGTMIISYMNPVSVCVHLAFRLVPIVLIEVGIQRFEENQELERQQEYKPTKKAKKAKKKHYL